MNYMKEVAQMLGVELGEEFKISYTHDVLCGRSKYNFAITENGLIEIVGKSCFERNETLMELLNGECKVIKLPKPILDEVEKEYLSAVIKPFRNKIEYIAKYNDDREYISITYKDLNGGTFSMAFPSFKKGTMYKGMELGKRYSLEDLEL